MSKVISLWFRLNTLPWIVVKFVLRLMLGRRKANSELGKFLKLHPANSLRIGRGRFAHLYFEENVDKIIKRILPQNGVFVDVGANIGTYTFLAKELLKNDGKIVAVDPDPRIYKYLTSHPIFQKSKNIKIINKAVWVSNGLSSFILGKSTLFSSLTPLTRFKQAGAFKNIEYIVETIRLKQLIESFEIVDVIKMDIEGAELQVLCDPTLRLEKVKNVIIEMHYKITSEESKK